MRRRADVTPRFFEARSHWNAEFDGTNSFVTDFRYEG
jgi:hypothetical protein